MIGSTGSIRPMTDDALADAVLDATLPQAQWTHAAHITTAHVLVRRLGARPALEALRAAIPRLNDAHGVPNDDGDGYHETITVWFVSAIADAVARGLDVPATLAALPSSAPLAYWSKPVLMSPPARRGWVAPDRAVPPFPLLVAETPSVRQ